MNLNNPIGVFDSGLGGLTVARAIKQLLPDEQIIYFGDTVHLPYGDKSAEAITYYSKKIADYLIQSKCKVILIACNTASAIAYDKVKAQIGQKAHVINVIDPVIEYVANQSFEKIGVIGTKNTISSNTYYAKIKALKPAIHVMSLATPMFVPMIEEGFVYDDISNAIIRAYLSDASLENIEALILGCTHYPIIKNQISRYYNFDTEVLDSAIIVASYLKLLLEKANLLKKDKTMKQDLYFVSDYTPYFPKISKMFFEKEIAIEQLDLWK